MDRPSSIARGPFAAGFEKLKAQGFSSLVKIASISYQTFSEKMRRHLNEPDCRRVYQTAKRYQANLRVYQAKLQARANPQLGQCRHLNSPVLNRENRSYETYFEQKTHIFVQDTSVASMFSPAAYLTELYREGRTLHATESPYNLDNRRPDLQNLLLTQANLDEVVTTLALSNDILSQTIAGTQDADVVLDEVLAGETFPFDLPFHKPFDRMIQALAVRQTDFAALAETMANQIDETVDDQVRTCFAADLNMGLYNLLTTAGNLADHFGDAVLDQLHNVDVLCQTSGIDRDMLNALLTSPAFYKSAGAYSGLDGPRFFGDVQEPGAVIGGEYGGSYLETAPSSDDDPDQLNQEVLQICNGRLSRIQLDNIASVMAPSGQVADFLVLPSTKDRCVRLVFRSAQWDRTEDFTLSLSVDGQVLLERSLSGQPSRQFTSLDVALQEGGGSFDFSAQIDNETPTTTTVTYAFADMEESFFVKLSKLVRLCQKTGRQPHELDSLIDPTPGIDPAMLSLCGRIKQFQADYGLNWDDAAVLAGRVINVYARQGELSQFDRLFNNPPLGEGWFRLEETAPVDLNSDAATRQALKRAFGVDDVGLATLVACYQGPANTQIFKNLTDLSALYRLVILAKVNHLNVVALAVILEVIFPGQPISNFSQDEVATVGRTCSWMSANTLEANGLSAMTTTVYPTTMTPEIQHFLETCFNLAIDLEVVTDQQLIGQLAPVMMGFFQLESEPIGVLLQQWLEAIAASRGLLLLTMRDFYSGLVAYLGDNDPAKEPQLVAFSHALAQLTLIIRQFSLQRSELTVLTAQPHLVQADLTVFDASYVNLVSLTKMQRWQACLGEGVEEAFAALHNQSLTADLLARLLGENSDEVDAVWAKLALAPALACGVDGDRISQALAAAHRIGVSGDVLFEVFDLTVTATFAAWDRCAQAVLVGLPPDRNQAVYGRLDELLSTALCAYYLEHVAPTVTGVTLTTRDEMFKYLLMDNQVGYQITTTAVAAAVESLQNYIHRCLQQGEAGVMIPDYHPFFEEWNAYNCRYSSWAGLSQLVYYPENYLDPALRYKKTALQDQLNMEISQNLLTEDRATQAYLNYLDGFEQIANLKVLCGYHDDEELVLGFTYFVARTMVTPYRYYWRNLEQGLRDENGRYYPTAWSNWEEIDMPIHAINDEVRPVIFNGRLYLSWIEQSTEITESETAGSPSEGSEINVLMLGYRLISGKWSPPITYQVTLDDSGFRYHLSYHGILDGITLYFYTSDSSYLASYLIDNILNKRALTSVEKDQIETLISNNLNDDTYSNKVIRKIRIPAYSVSVLVPDIPAPSGDFLIESLSADATIDVTNPLAPKLNASFNLIYQALKENLIVHELNPELALLTSNTDQASGNIPFTVNDISVSENFNPPYNSFMALFLTPLEIFFNRGDVEISGLQIRSCTFKNSKDLELENDSEGGNLPSGNLDINNHIIIEFDGMNYSADLENFPLILKFIINYGLVLEQGQYFRYHNVTINLQYQPDRRSFNSQEFQFGSIDNETTVELGTHTINESQFFDIDAGTNSVEAQITLLRHENNTDSTFFDDSVTYNIEAHGEPDPEDFYYIAMAGEAAYLGHNQQPYRTRLNTLFSRELIKRTFSGLGHLFTWDTQNLPEPKLGLGRYVFFQFPAYDVSSHGSTGKFSVVMLCYEGTQILPQTFQLAEGWLTADGPVDVRFFVPYTGLEWNDGSTIVAHIGVQYQGMGPPNPNQSQRYLIDAASDGFDHYGGNTNRTPGLDESIIDDVLSEPMDFYGANGLSFWELFYYTPMLITNRLHQAGNFTDAKTWLTYVFSPRGYEGERDRFWNVRPLEEDTKWNDILMDDSDPDNIALSDPMHYKVYSFTVMLDLLITQGDMAYRGLERDSLTEAKLWYGQALDLLGPQADIPLAQAWAEPSLAQAADDTLQTYRYNALAAIRGDAQAQTADLERTANSLTALFLPPVNRDLQGYWTILGQRLYNLRHNLSIDGQALNLPIFAAPADPKALQQTAAAGYGGGDSLPGAGISAQRFPFALEHARYLVATLTRFGGGLQMILESKDGEALETLLTGQAADLMRINDNLQDKTIADLEQQKQALVISREGAQRRRDGFQALIDEDVSPAEQQAIDKRLRAGVDLIAANAFHTTAAALDTLPNIFGLSTGGGILGAIMYGGAVVLETAATASIHNADAVGTKEQYRRRRQDWQIQRDDAGAEVDQLTHRLEACDIQLEAAALQKKSVALQQDQLQVRLDFLKNKFSNQALYDWMNGRLATIYYPFYDLALSSCLRAQLSYRYESGDTRNFIQPGAWDSNYAGLLAGETLSLYLVQMESAYQEWDSRTLEINRTVSMAAAMGLTGSAFNQQVVTILESDNHDSDCTANGHELRMAGDNTSFEVAINLENLAIGEDYPQNLGDTRLIQQISVSLPALLGPYQDVQAVLSYAGSKNDIHRGCIRSAVSHGIQDGGLFQLDFNDDKYLPFEGLPIDDSGGLVLSFPNASPETAKQNQLLRSLSDIVLHIRYTIRAAGGS